MHLLTQGILTTIEWLDNGQFNLQLTNVITVTKRRIERNHHGEYTLNQRFLWDYHFEFSWFFFLRNSPPLFSFTRSSSFSVIHVSVNIKNNVEKDTTLLSFFLSKSRRGHAISFQIKPSAAFGLLYLLIKLFYIGMSVLRTVGRSGGRAEVRSRDC